MEYHNIFKDAFGIGLEEYDNQVKNNKAPCSWCKKPTETKNLIQIGRVFVCPSCNQHIINKEILK